MRKRRKARSEREKRIKTNAELSVINRMYAKGKGSTVPSDAQAREK